MQQVENRVVRIAAISVILIALAGCCCHPVQRFVPTGDGMALDTKTGQQCMTIPKTADLTQQLKEGGVGVFCYDLYTGSK